MWDNTQYAEHQKNQKARTEELSFTTFGCTLGKAFKALFTIFLTQQFAYR